MAKKKSFWKIAWEKTYWPRWIVLVVIAIVGLYKGASIVNKNSIKGDNNNQVNINDSNMSQDQLIIGNNNTQTKETYIYNYYGLTDLEEDELCSEALKRSCFPVKTENKIEDSSCENNITYVKGISANGALIDGCDVLLLKLDYDIPVKSGTIELFTKFNDISMDNNRYLFDVYGKYNENRISLYLQFDKFITFSLFDSDSTSIQIGEKLTEEELKNWIHIAVTWQESEGNINLFINGKLRKKRTLSDVSFDEGFEAMLLGSDIQGKNQANAIIDEITISNVVRSDDWVMAQYQSGKGDWLTIGPQERNPNFLEQ